MKRSWLGVALLSSSWIFGLNYFYSYHWPIWVMMAVTGAICLTDGVRDIPDYSVPMFSIALLLPVVFFTPWPYRMALLLPVFGLVILALPLKYKWIKRLGAGFTLAGLILVIQSLVLHIYMNLTSRSHELPYPLPKLLEAMATLLGMETAAEGSNFAVFSMRKIHQIGATRELFLDPATLSFLIGGLVLIFFISWRGAPDNPDIKKLMRRVLAFALPIIIWLPVRTGFLLSVYLHRVLFTDYEQPMHLISQFWNPWLHLALLAVPVLLAIRMVDLSGEKESSSVISSSPIKNIISSKRNKGKLFSSVMFFWAGCLVLTLFFFRDPQGPKKKGRILVDEYHSQAPWSGKEFDTTRTDKPFDTEWYGHDSGYNYACIYDYCSHFYEMSRLFTKINDEILREVDVLFLKVPSASYSEEETASITRFVERGGGLLLMGEHTNVFGSCVNLNRIAKNFGFKFRYDCLFGIDSVFKEAYHPPRIPHPIIRNMPFLDFAVSCSIDPGMSFGQAVIRATGLKNLTADYHVSNFYPQAVDEPQMRYGAFIQLWATRYGNGRVAAFTDSTIFANFSAFEPGKSELMMGMLEWLNHENSQFPKSLLAVIGLILCSISLILTKFQKETWMILLAAGTFGWTIAGFGLNYFGMKLPHAKLPMVRVAMERSISGASLPENGFISGEKDCFGQFERSILRLGYFISRPDPDQSFDGNLLIFLYPKKKPGLKFLTRLDDYITSGGKVLILDSPENTSSTSNDLLQPFGLTTKRTDDLRGVLTVSAQIPQIEVASALEVSGGKVIASLADRPVAAAIKKGNGSLTFIGFGSRFSDANMGVIADVIPDDELRKVFDFEFNMLKTIIESAH